MTTIKLKAFEIREPNEGCCTVVFAEKNVVARRQGALNLGCEFEDVESCYRVPHFDQFSPGPVPLHATLEAGWWHTCCGCGCTFDKDGYTPSYTDDEDSPYIEISPVEDSKGNPYCTESCMMADWQEKRLRSQQEHAMIEYVLSKWPQALKVWTFNTKSNFKAPPDTCNVLLPHLQDTITWVINSPTAGVSRRDEEKFKELYSPKVA